MHPHRNLAIDRAIARNKNFTADEVAKSNTLRAVAIDFIETYEGSAGFIHRLLHGTPSWKLSNKQLEVALKIMIEESKQSAPVTPRDPIHDGRYAVLFENHEYTFKIDLYEGDRYNVPAGTQSVFLLIGPNNTRDYSPIGFIYPNRQFRIKHTLRDNARLINAVNVLLGDDDPIKFGEAYALKTRLCWHCHRDLTKSKSIVRGLGPVCAKKLGVDDPDKSAIEAYSKKHKTASHARSKIERPNKRCEQCLGEGEIPDDDLAGDLGLPGIYVPCSECMPNAYNARVAELTAAKPAHRAGAELFDE